MKILEPYNKVRHSGLELLRIMSMFFILALHVNFYVFGAPTKLELSSTTWGEGGRLLWESLMIVGVDCFILISGWFGIRPKVRRVAEILFQCFFFGILLYVVGWIVGISFSGRYALKYLLLAGRHNWFIKAYLIMYALSPVLEAFAAAATKRQFAFVIASFFTLQTIYGWIFPVASFNDGYSAISFVGLYLIARYIRRFPPAITRKSAWCDLIVFIMLSIITAVMYVCSVYCKMPVAVNWFAYCSPLVIAAAIFLFLFFSKMHFQSRLVDSIARSSYAVYLLHVHPCIFWPILVVAVNYIIANYSALERILLLPLLLSVIFVVSIICDQVRILVWRYIVQGLERNCCEQ